MKNTGRDRGKAGDGKRRSNEASDSRPARNTPDLPAGRSNGRTMDFGLLERYDIPVLPYAVAKSLAQAQKAAEKIRFPLALKLISKNALHKTDSGALALNIGNIRHLVSEYGRLMKIAKGDAQASVLVQAYRPGRFELIVGGRTDSQFGPVVMLGMGGIYAEVLRDIAIRVCPLDEREARSMVRSLKSYPILAGARGRKPVDEAALARILMRVSRLMEKERPAELDINPVLARTDGLWAADVRVLK